jgi:hypothetical protein
MWQEKTASERINRECWIQACTPYEKVQFRKEKILI